MDRKYTAKEFKDLERKLNTVTKELETLRRENERLESALGDSPVIIYRADPSRDYITTFVSENVHDILGYEPEEITTQNGFWRERVHPDDRDHAMSFRDELKVGICGTYEYRLLRKDGTWAWLRDRKCLVADAPGEPAELIGYRADITDTHTEQEDLLKRKRLFKTIFNNAASGIAICGPDGTFGKANEKWLELLGRPLDELIGKTPLDFTHPHDQPLCRERMEKMLAGDTGSYRMEKRFLRSDGSAFWVDIVTKRIDGPEGDTQGLVCVMNDITERIEMERSLRQSEHEKKAILDTISEAVTFQDQNHRILWANRAMCETTGLPPEEIIGAYCYDLWQTGIGACPDCPASACLEQGKPVEALARASNGRTYRTKTYPARLRDDQSPGVLVVSQDVTEQTASEEEMRKAMAMAEDATKMKDEFLANMSHELRAPLNGMLGMLDVLMDSKLDADQRDSIEIALAAGEGLLAIINDILDFSKLQADKITLSRNEFDLRQSIRTVINTYKDQSVKRGVEVSSMVDKNVPELLVGDEGRIRQILFNLVGNSVKFTKEGSVRLETFILRKTANPHNARLLFTITDTGIGIPADQLETIFEPFVQLNWAKSRKYEGTGLGLGIVKRLVTLMGGIITVESEVDKGTTINFWINVQVP
ncbi:PAS domain-containing protein [Desulfovibrio ferrophilus]|uniref:histidine kinase n=1 Tax=Desulfovibrio ferrophilus TaxID=241368 RepID=A0A2Z6AZQ1_9BACT|nr:PAS domain-containing protein [Desulfovibrio ferrophilus]BBD08729.1 sensory box histidine kinase/response regulator [Desulfovibrio ferrophilus]